MKNDKNKAKFTPGPWIAQTKKGITTKNGLCNVIQKKGPMFLLVDGVEHTEAEANAHLIAAAPDMFEALEEALYWIGECFPSGLPDHPDAVISDDDQEMMDKFSAILKKAKGES